MLLTYRGDSSFLGLCVLHGQHINASGDFSSAGCCLGYQLLLNYYRIYAFKACFQEFTRAKIYLKPSFVYLRVKGGWDILCFLRDVD